MTVTRCPSCHCWRGPSQRCSGCDYYDRRSRERTTGRRCHHCYTLLPDDTHSRCTTCRDRRRTPDWEYRKELAAARFPAPVRQQLLDRLTAGERLSDVCADLEVTQQRVHGWAAYDDGWQHALDQALMAGRDPELPHGTHHAYRHHRCRCPECREAKAAPPQPWRQLPTTTRTPGGHP